MVSRIVRILLIPYRKEIIQENLHRAFPSKKIDEIKYLRQAYQKHLSQVIIESLKGFSLSRETLAERFIFLNAEVANKYYTEGKSIILVLGHVGNWEWGQAVVSHYLKHNCVGVYKPLSDQSLDKYILVKRSKSGVKLLPQKNLVKYLISHQKELNVYIFIADQYPPNEPRLKLDFLSTPTYFDASVEKIAMKYDLPVIYADISKIGNAQYETKLIELCADSALSEKGFITGQYAELLGNNILRKPELWLWSHRRWKNRR